MAELDLAAWTSRPSLVLLATGAVLWTLAILGHILRSSRRAFGKLCWCAGALLLLPLGGMAYYLFGRTERRAPLASAAYLFTVAGILVAAVFAAITQQVAEVDFRVTLLLALGVTSFFAYAYDKLIAGGSATRVPERTFHALALVGGFAGGWLGMFVLRHKINWRKHPLFPAVLSLATALHLATAFGLMPEHLLAAGVTIGLLVVWVVGGSRKARR